MMPWTGIHMLMGECTHTHTHTHTHTLTHTDGELICTEGISFVLIIPYNLYKNIER